MVIGNGMIARRFSKYANDEKQIIFASGVSNSNNTDWEPFKREADLLRQTLQHHPFKKIIYFSTCSVYDFSMQASPYVQHKLAIEQLIKESGTNYCIFRVSNPVGFTDNQNTVLNYFFYHIANETPFELWKNAGRNLIDLDDMYLVCKTILTEREIQQATVNIASPKNSAVSAIITVIEDHLCIKGKYFLVDKGSSPKIDVAEILPIFEHHNIKFDQTYLKRLLQKYYPAA